MTDTEQQLKPLYYTVDVTVEPITLRLDAAVVEEWAAEVDMSPVAYLKQMENGDIRDIAMKCGEDMPCWFEVDGVRTPR